MKKTTNTRIRFFSAMLALLMCIAVFAGCQGEQGPKGDKGDPGEQGEPGINGIDGVNGLPGEKGDKGDPGTDGKDGVNGKDGIDGEDGVNGKDGVNGEDGIDGKDGDQVEFRTEGLWVQWKYQTDTEWTNLYEIQIAPTIGKRVTVVLATAGGVLPTNSLSKLEVTAGTSVYLPTPSYTGHTFLGWFEEGGTEAVANPYTVTEGTYLYARWQLGDPQIIIDPFEGISFSVSGISPYCTVSINNSNCSEDAQRYVEYSLDRTFYKNGDVAVITAKLAEHAFDSAIDYSLSSAVTTYTVTGQAEYVSSLAGIDRAEIKAEVDDYVAAAVGTALQENINRGGYGTYIPLFNVKVHCIIATNTTYHGTYLMTLKENKVQENYDAFPYNTLAFVYQIDWTGNSSYSGTIYTVIYASNIVKYPDGSFTWSLDTDGDRGIYFGNGTTVSLENCIAAHITAYTEDCNILKVDIE